jgi:hypothetical protein
VEFLRKLKRYKEEGRNIVYTDETYLHSSHTVPKSWNDYTSNTLKSPVAKGRRLIVVHAGDSKGLVKNGLLIFKSGLKSGDCQDDMNDKNYTKWLQEKLIPNLEPNSVVVIDNASYHNVTVEPNPNFNWRKKDIQKWLNERNIFFDFSETKPEVYEKIKTPKPNRQVYAIDKLLSEHGHSVLRLPPYHPELNPIELIWVLVKNYVAAHNVTFNLDDVWKIAVDKFNNVKMEEWKKICDHVTKIEDDYLQREHIVDEVQELIIRVGYDTDSSTDFFSESEDEVVATQGDDDLGCQPLL